MTPFKPAAVREALALATGPTINASHAQTCGWCLGEVAASEPITHTTEAGWCHEFCTTRG